MEFYEFESSFSVFSKIVFNLGCYLRNLFLVKFRERLELNVYEFYVNRG